MSRIDEALKRASLGSHSARTGRGQGWSGDASLRLADDLTIDQYPIERRAAEDPAIQTTTVPAEHIGRMSWTGSRSKSKATSLTSNHRLITGSNRDGVSLEQYRRLAATLHESHVERGLKTVMVTSAVPREGKTLTIVNLALTLSESYGRRVLLIDGDFRRPSLHEMLGVLNDTGLSEVLRDPTLKLPVLEIAPRLTFLPAGQLHENPHAAFSSERMRMVVQDAAQHFDWVLIDTPPVGLLSDAQILARLTQAVVFVIRAGSTPFRLVEKAIEEIGRESIIGTVLNGLEKKAMHSSGYYGDYYSRPEAF